MDGPLAGAALKKEETGVSHHVPYSNSQVIKTITVIFLFVYFDHRWHCGRCYILRNYSWWFSIQDINNLKMKTYRMMKYLQKPITRL